MLNFSYILKLIMVYSFILYPTFASNKVTEKDENKLSYKFNFPSLPREIQQRVMDHCDLISYLHLSNTSKLYKKTSFPVQHLPLLVSQVEEQPLYIVPYSSIISRNTIRANIFRYLRLAEQRILIISDQFTDVELVDYLISAKRRGIQVEVFVGENPYFTKSLEQKIKDENIVYQSKKSSGKGRMHNKFILIDDHGTLLGSPNATTSAFDNNIESMVAIYNKKVNQLYKEYYDFLKTPDNEGLIFIRKQVELNKLMDAFNGVLNCPIKICLAPIQNIRSFVIKNIRESQIIAISMFLIGHANNPNQDIIETLIETAQRGSSILIKIDGEQLSNQTYMKAAIKDFNGISNIQTFAVYPSRGVLHDKLLLFMKDNKLYTILGSAGFTNNVQDNINDETMICIESNSIQRFYRRHFSSIKEGHPSVRKMKKLQ